MSAFLLPVAQQMPGRNHHMASFLQQLRRWCHRISSLESETSVGYGLQLLTDNTLLNPLRPYESIGPDVVQHIRDASGREPATRTMVRSSLAGHSVQIFLLRDCDCLNA
jgi:hypothetical protein